MKENTRLTVEQASKILGINQQCLRISLQKKLLPIGYATKNTKGTGYRYFIYEQKVNEFIGNNGFEKLGEILSE